MGSEQGQLAGEGEDAEGAGLLELVDERLRYLRAGVGKFLDGEELHAVAAVHDVPCRRLTETGHGHERRAELPVLDQEFCRVRMIDIDRREGKAAQIEFIADLKRGEQIVVLGAGILVLLDLLQLFLDKLDAVAHHALVKATLLAAAIEVCGVERQRLVHLEPRDAESHHHVGRRMGVVLCYGEKGDDLNQLRDKAKRLAKTVLGTDPYMKK